MTAAAAPLLQVGSVADSAPAGVRAMESILARVDRLLARAVRIVAATPDGAPREDPLRGLFVSDADAGHLVRRGPEPLGHRLDGERPLVRLPEATPPWRRLAAVFGLDGDQLDALALALVPDVDLRYERIYGYLHDDMTRRRLTPDLAGQLLGRSFAGRVALRGLFFPDAPLVRYDLVRLVAEQAQPQAPAIGHGIKVDDGIVDFLLGTAAIDRSLAAAARWSDADHESSGRDPEGAARAALTLIERELRHDSEGDARFLLAGPDGALQADIARRAAHQLEQPLLVADIARLEGPDDGFAPRVRAVARAACLHNALTFWIRGDRVASEDAESGARLAALIEALDDFRPPGNIISLATAAAGISHAAGESFVTIHLPLPAPAERQRSWRTHLAHGRIPVDPTLPALLADVFEIDDARIRRAVEGAAAAARRHAPDAPTVTSADLFESARRQVLRSLPRYASRVPAGPRWDDIVLPADHLEQLRELCDRVRHRGRVLDDWGFRHRLTLGRGVAALFAGPSGTGKTMAAQILAATLGMDLYRVEIPAVVSKYIGETEKALDQLFREAQGTSVILFFDEADALFGKRSEVKDAHDRYANIEISYLLQAIEQYDGLTILATNLRHNVDDAFVRRLACSITFPMPEEPERHRIWEKSWPASVPLADDLDLPFLARQFKLAGGNIRNVALSAAFAAAATGGQVTMAHVVRGVRREFQKMGKTCVESDFGPYYQLLSADRRPGQGVT